ncbi:CRISPR-associated helicase Cas3' [Methylomagnum sp.]
MGMGKTEAALACAYRLLSEGKATGIYFALPTQVTSNRIHERVGRFTRAVCPDTPSTRLIHANAWLMTDVEPSKPAASGPVQGSEDARAGRDWFASSKRGILAPFGVGTVDQALLAVVAAKHFFVRRFGLAGKVVILDEVHSYDFYTGTLIRALCQTLEDLGCTVILLSATLTPERRAALLGESESPEAAAYPLITGRTALGVFIPPRPAEAPPDHAIQIEFVEPSAAIHAAWAEARRGTCVLWICDTVASAQLTYGEFEALVAGDGEAPKLGLLHSRFPYFRREELENQWMEALGKDGEAHGLRPKGCVLVSTQVVEQSVDLDADLLVTELAPTDMLLQRMGRLWRHPRGPRPTTRPACWILRESRSLDDFRGLGKQAVREAFGAKAWVYAPYVLLRSLEEWSSRSVVAIPSGIRGILEKTYIDREDEPPGWLAWKQKLEGDKFAHQQLALMSSNIMNTALDDQEGAQTRVSEIKTVQVILATSKSGKDITLLNGDVVSLADDVFRMDTARGLHRNIVKLPKSTFAAFESESTTHKYVKGEQAIGWVQPDGVVNIAGLKTDYSLYWHTHRGLEIRRGEQRKTDYESCD